VHVGAGEDELLRIKRSSVVRVHVEHNDWNATLRRCRHETADLNSRIETQQREASSQRVVERSPIAQP
jgi:hypothetical protein